MSISKIILVDEFHPQSSSPNAKHRNDLYQFLLKKQKLVIENIYFANKYTPGGLKPKRIFNLFISLFLICFKILKEKFKKNNFTIICTTSPPLFHLFCCLLSKIFKFNIIIWFLDAHPEIEARIFDKYKLKMISYLLRKIEKKLLKYSDTIICLDTSMKIRLIEIGIDKEKIEIIPPWATFFGTHSTVKFKKIDNNINFIYAGNYGKLHCLQNFVQQIKIFSAEEQKNITITFAGMQSKSKIVLNRLFSETNCQLIFLPRFENINDLFIEFDKNHFGIVSLSKSHFGLAAPSKMFSYLCKGLAIYYVGPKNTLAHNYCLDGYGVSQDNIYNSFNEWKEILNSNSSSKEIHSLKDTSLEKFYQIYERISKHESI